LSPFFTDKPFRGRHMLGLDDPEIFRSILENLQTGIYLVDKDRKIVFWNEGAEKITGYLRQDVVGRFHREQLLQADREGKNPNDEPADPVNAAFRDGKVTSTDVLILHREGYRVPVVLRTVPIRNEHGVVIGVAESLEENQSVSAWAKRQAKLEDYGCLDEMTGALSHGFIESLLQESLITFAHHNVPFGILLFEVDQIDSYRAKFGPGVVRAILRVVATTIENNLGPSDLVGYWSENRFVALLQECGESEVAQVAERLQKMVSDSKLQWWGEKFSITGAFGGAGSRPEDTLEILLERAEKSLMESVRRAARVTNR
jgi:PAS domain S-box-containing protein/diguanylate cyclase (GGDEF)-like protein